MEAYTREAACQDRTAKAGFQKQKKTKENKRKPGKTGESERWKYVALLAPGLVEGEWWRVEGGGRIVDELGGAEEKSKQVVLRKMRAADFHERPAEKCPRAWDIHERPAFFHERPAFFHEKAAEKCPRAWDIHERPAEKNDHARNQGLDTILPPPSNLHQKPLTLHPPPETTHPSPLTKIRCK